MILKNTTFAHTRKGTRVTFSLDGQDYVGRVDRVENQLYQDGLTGRQARSRVFNVEVSDPRLDYTLRFGGRMECTVRSRERR